MAGPGSGGNVLAALCSLFIPGLGQLLQGRLGMAIVHWLLLDSRVVDVPRLYTPTFVMIFCGKPFFFTGLKNGSCFSDHGGA